jgi:hypothetical protein
LRYYGDLQYDRLMQTPSLHDAEWEYVRTLLPPDLEQSARRTSALIRCRNIPDAAALLRVALAYGLSDLSLKDVAAWASALQLAEITGPGLFYRLRESEPWLEHVLGQLLSEQLPAAAGGFRLCVVDATVINGPGQKPNAPGQKPVHWRAHACITPTTGELRTVELTDDSGGEKFSRYRFGAGDVVLGDRGYASARGIYAVRQAEAHVVVRFHPGTLRTCDEKRQRIYLAEREAEVPKTGAVEFRILVPIPPERKRSHKTWDSAKAIAWVPARAVAARTRKQEVIWVLTTLPARQMPAIGILGLYRMRWQIELLFKRLKSLLHLDALPSRQGPTAKSWMLARLIAAALAERLLQPAGPFSPWGYDLRRAIEGPQEATEPTHA